MVFALMKHGGALIAFPTMEEAEAHCEGADVERGLWSFFAEDGSPLEPHFRRPSNGTYVLERAMSGLWLQERLAQVRLVEGCGLATLPEVIEHLKIERGKRAARGI